VAQVGSDTYHRRRSQRSSLKVRRRRIAIETGWGRGGRGQYPVTYRVHHGYRRERAQKHEG
jgi:hypothetical protein